MPDERWAEIDRWFEQRLVPSDAALTAALDASAAAGLPPIQVPPNQGKLLQLLVAAQGARRVLEIGTLGGYSTIWLARGLAEGGRVVTLEVDPHHAEVARTNLVTAGLADVVDVRVGPALETLPVLDAEGAGPFDLTFIDADKPGTADYFGWAVRLSRPGALIVVDNVVRGGAVADDATDDPNALGIRRFVAAAAAEPRVSATVLQTVGAKGHDGFAVVTVDPDHS